MFNKEASGCLLTKCVEPVFGDNVVNCSSKKLVFLKQIGEDFSILKLVYGDLTYPCRHPNKSFLGHARRAVTSIGDVCVRFCPQCTVALLFQ